MNPPMTDEQRARCLAEGLDPAYVRTFGRLPEGEARQRRWTEQTIRTRVRGIPFPGTDGYVCAHRHDDYTCGPELFAEYIVDPREGGSTSDPDNVELVCVPHSNTKEANHNARRFARALPTRRMRASGARVPDARLTDAPAYED